MSRIVKDVQPSNGPQLPSNVSTQDMPRVIGRLLCSIGDELYQTKLRAGTGKKVTSTKAILEKVVREFGT